MIDKYEISIQTLDYGYVVRVGCKSLAFEDKEDLKAELCRYLDSPEETQKEYVKKFGWDRHMLMSEPIQAPDCGDSCP